MKYNIFSDTVKKIEKKTNRAFKKDWKFISIKENNENLVLVPEEFCNPYYANDMKITKDKRVFLRKSVFLMFLQANKILGGLNLELKIFDGWRSVELQEILYWLYMKKFTISRFSNLIDLFSSSILPMDIKERFEHVSCSLQVELHNINKKHVSWPSASIDSPSSHVTGGSIDVCLYQDGQPVDLGVEFDSMEEKAGAFYHLRSDRANFKNDDLVCYCRNALLYAMTSAGFSCYPPEIWHFNYGNQMHSLVTDQVACYSYIEP